ncbi:YcxB family protein [Flavobacterium sp. RSB2_4_14]|uniref:YcxB family protein n=1 Tax=Flavobacterium sp. RSB2_4_14 TaxID=3447665 RepID=UPI003F2F2A6B
MIKTNKIQLTTNTLFSTLLRVYFKKRWWLILWMMIFGILVSTSSKRGFNEIFIMVVSFAYPFLIVLQYWRFAKSKDNKIFLLEKEYEIQDNKIIATLSDGTTNTIMTEHFVKVIKLKTAYLLYLSKTQFIYIPKDAFKSEAEKSWFEQEIINKIKPR